MYQHTLLATPLNDKFLEVDTKMIQRVKIAPAVPFKAEKCSCGGMNGSTFYCD